MPSLVFFLSILFYAHSSMKQYSELPTFLISRKINTYLKLFMPQKHNLNKDLELVPIIILIETYILLQK